MVICFCCVTFIIWLFNSGRKNDKTKREPFKMTLLLFISFTFFLNCKTLNCYSFIGLLTLNIFIHTYIPSMLYAHMLICVYANCAHKLLCDEPIIRIVLITFYVWMEISYEQLNVMHKLLSINYIIYLWCEANQRYCGFVFGFFGTLQR